jgi:geranylgeranyl transferase type-1 subunit beta
MGLAALATLKEPCLKPFDPVLCVSIQQRDRVNTQRKDALVFTRTYWKYGYSFSIREDDPNFEKKLADSEDAPKFTVGTGI